MCLRYVSRRRASRTRVASPGKYSKLIRFASRKNVLPLKIWATPDTACGKRIAPALPEMCGVIERFGELSLSDEVRAKLHSISAATIDRLLAPDRARVTLHGQAMTEPGTLLKLPHERVSRTHSGWRRFTQSAKPPIARKRPPSITGHRPSHRSDRLMISTQKPLASALRSGTMGSARSSRTRRGSSRKVNVRSGDRAASRFVCGECGAEVSLGNAR